MHAKLIVWQPGCESLGASVAAIGVFDGVHIGHQALIREAITEARARSVSAVAVTFDRDPDQVVTPDRAARQLLTIEDKYALLGAQGLDAILVIPFNPAFADVTPEAFADEILCKALCTVAIHVGFDFRFGRKASGSMATLQELGKTRGFEVRPHGLLRVGDAPVTATRIRALVANGNVVEAAALLGRPTRVTGTVHHGRGEGAELGFPTANIEPVPYAALPAPGVYAARVVLQDGSKWPAAVNVGVPPTFAEANDLLEVHIIGYSGDLYGSVIAVDFLEKLRDLKTFVSLDELKATVAENVRQAVMCYTSAAVTTTPA
ncbi:MAG: bifunctional riboflavin kinase/FAD synthetase [Coriobacteriia bacterium]|nr:bifunctional riboflavin kinase/FAD synthetase [Coriobacteriia bacterium]